MDEELTTRQKSIKCPVSKAEQMLKRVAGRLNVGWKLRRSRERVRFPYTPHVQVRGGVPHLVVQKGGVHYSVCYFGKTKLFKIFYPWPSYGRTQTVVIRKTIDLVVEFFANLE